jgi:hypothetical protein
LQIGKKAAKSLSNDLGTGPAFAPNHPAAFVFIAGDRAFFAVKTRFHIRSLTNFKR